MCRRLWHTHLRFLENLLENENLVCSASARTKTALGGFNCFVASFFKELCIHFSKEAKEGLSPVVRHNLLFLYGYD